jgi:CheY-like chemotaxis protein
MAPFDGQVLIVDDHTDTRESLAEVLQEEGYETVTVANGLEALVHLRTHALPRVILLNTIMPVMDGREFRRHMKRDPRLAEIPVVVISGADLDLVKSAFADVVACFRKPVDLPALLSILGQMSQPHVK